MVSRKFVLAQVACAAALALVACGGGGGAGTTAGTQSATNASTSGTITGFGSVIIDGVRIDDHSVLSMLEKEDGTLVPTQMKIGQQVVALHDDNHVASSVHVLPSVEGTVDAVDTTAATLTVLGQVIKINSDPTAGPVTVFEAPYASLADVHAGDSVEIHAIPRLDPVAKTWSLQATRVEKAGADSALHTSGIVSNLSTSASTFSLGSLVIDYSQAKLLPAGVTLANGEMVHVAIPLGTVVSGTPVKAVVVKVRTHSDESHSHMSEVGGKVDAVDATAKTFTVGGVTVDASAAVFPQPGQSLSTLAAGSYIVAIGTYDSNGVLKAQRVIVRGAMDAQEGGDAELHGTVLNYVSMSNFTVRGVTVDASAATIDGSCGAITQLANNMQVGIEGAVQPSGVVKAATVSCEQEQAGQSIVGADGVVSSVDTASSSFVLATQSGNLTVKWTSTTNFVKVDPNALAGMRLEVQGMVQGGVLTATEVEAH